MGINVVYKASLPEGVSGQWAVQKFKLTKEDLRFDFLNALRDARDVGEDRRAKPGSYTKLTRDGQVIMSDTPAEMRDLDTFERAACGPVLIHGLGLGCAVELALLKPKVSKVTVIELSPDVIKLVAPTLYKRFGRSRLEIIEADAFEWKPKGLQFSVVWSDIWDYISADNLKEMSRLRRKWSRSCVAHLFWCERQCRYARLRSAI